MVILMNPISGTVAPESAWRYAYSLIPADERSEVWGGQNFDDAWLVPVVRNSPDAPGYDDRFGDWRDAE